MANCFGLRTARLGAACPHGRPRLHFLEMPLHWSSPFEDPIILGDGRKLLTLKDAADYITKPAEERIRLARMASGDRSADAVRPRRCREITDL